MRGEGSVDRSRYARCAFDSPVELISAHYLRHRYVPHAHTEYVIAVIESGTSRLDHAWGCEYLSAGSTVLIPPGVFHAGAPNGVDGCRSSMFYVPAILMDRAVDRRGASTQFADYPVHVSDPALAHRLLQLHRLLSLGPEPSTELALSFRNALGDLASSMKACRRAGIASTRLIAAREFIDAHYLARLTVNEMASEAGLSASQFSREFRRAFGAAPYLYLENKRMQHARAAITAGERISAAAFDCRFSDQSHLTRRFKRTWGITPGVVSALVRSERQRST